MVLFRFAAFLIMGVMPCASFGQFNTHFVLPSDTHSAIMNVHGPHEASRGKSGKLLVSFPGTGSPASAFHNFDSVASGLGYYSVSLDYKNEVITTVCRPSRDESCFNSFRQEIVFGTPVSDSVKVDSMNSIVHRLKRLLEYMTIHFPEEGWSQFLKDGQISWSHVTTVGHSQGAGHAAYLGKYYKLDKVIALSGPQDFLDQFEKPAPWIGSTGKTQRQRFYSMLHHSDPFGFQKQLVCNLLLSGTKASDTVSIEPMKGSKGNILVMHLPTPNPHGASMLKEHAEAWKALLMK